MCAGLSPFTCNTGGVAEESVEDDAAAGGHSSQELKMWGLAHGNWKRDACELDTTCAPRGGGSI
jgi:hypothetical protein